MPARYALSAFELLDAAVEQPFDCEYPLGHEPSAGGALPSEVVRGRPVGGCQVTAALTYSGV